MAYLDYDYFTAQGGKQTICDAAFCRYAYRASAAVDEATFNRVSRMPETPEAVKLCCVELINSYSQNDVTSECGKLVSASNDGYGESYQRLQPGEFAAFESAVIRSYLLNVRDAKGTPLLYLGVF